MNVCPKRHGSHFEAFNSKPEVSTSWWCKTHQSRCASWSGTSPCHWLIAIHTATQLQLQHLLRVLTQQEFLPSIHPSSATYPGLEAAGWADFPEVHSVRETHFSWLYPRSYSLDQAYDHRRGSVHRWTGKSWALPSGSAPPCHSSPAQHLHHSWRRPNYLYINRSYRSQCCNTWDWSWSKDWSGNQFFFWGLDLFLASIAYLLGLVSAPQSLGLILVTIHSGLCHDLVSVKVVMTTKLEDFFDIRM